ncbi:VOC family protein [Ornithinimicrobium faecis]|uniref:VOC family protein n=1 Tax=Ornithinimicrobium faecis TaxID=2934158 RepID=A0ABY4YRB7_9MICO|nr:MULTISPECIES: VOC family protein [unclassified Ornithinimicrobium]USQ79050.1 VOC family protein [Ornithinimicrobium sp. HY1793]
MSDKNPTSPILNNCFVIVDDVDAALAFYRDAIGLDVRQDVSQGDYRWLTFTPPGQPEIEIVIQDYKAFGVPMSEDDKSSVADLMAKGVLSSLVFEVGDVDALFEKVLGSGAEVLQEPADQFYGVRDCAFRDPAGNMIRFKTPLASSEGDADAGA